MKIEASFVGRSYRGFRYRVGLEKIREFALAIDDPDPRYLGGPEVAEQDIIAPPTFCAIFAIQPFRAAIDDPELGVDQERLVHLQQELVFHRPVRDRDLVLTEGEIVELRQRRGLAWLVVESRSRLADGQRLVEGTWTALVRL